jgi:NAD(P)-dependent dehydrogenase (short-subunit alcohol dehydrogenase family)
MISLDKKVAVITGAGSGIGAGIAQRLFGLGAQLAIIGKTEKNVKALAQEMNGPDRIDSFACDVNDEERLNEVKEIILSKRGRIDILVTCAAAPGSSGKLEETSFPEWRSVLSTDLDGVFLSCKVFGSVMKKNGYGRIVNLTSFHNIATYPERVVYNAAKSGVEGISRGLAVEWAPYGITVNTVAPGPIRTPRTSGFLAQSPDVESGMLGRTPNVRIGETEDVSSLIAYLVSDEARHVNGQQIVVDGGWTKSAWWGDHTKR